MRARNQIRFLLTAVSILSVVMSGCSRFGSRKGKADPRIVEAERIAAESLKTNVLADPPSPGAIVVRQLARLDPEAAALQKTVEDLERSALKQFIDEVAEKHKLTKPTSAISATNQRRPTGQLPAFAFISVGSPAALAMFQASSSAPQIGASPEAINFIALFVSVFNDMVSSAVTEKGEINPTKRVENGDSYTDMSMEFGRGDAGATKFGFKMTTRGTNGKRSLDSDLQARVEGVRCPDVLGNVYFNLTVKLSGKHEGSSYIQEVKAKVMAKTNDEADMASFEMKLNQGIQESTGARHTYIESEFDVTQSGDDPATAQNPRLIRASQDLGPHPEELDMSGKVAAMRAGFMSLRLAEAMWKNGGCVAIQAKSPGSVQPSSVTEIPVDVKHKYEGGSVPSKVTVKLEGETSVAPMQIDQTAGKLNYTAPPEKNKSATIKLEARSKRGRAELALKASTGGNAYRITGNLDEASQSGTVCDSSQPFTIGGTLNFQFTPNSPTTGTYTYTGPFSATGSGPYVINGDGTMKLDGTGCIQGSGCATYSHVWKAEPIDPATCGGNQ